MPPSTASRGRPRYPAACCFVPPVGVTIRHISPLAYRIDRCRGGEGGRQGEDSRRSTVGGFPPEALVSGGYRGPLLLPGGHWGDLRLDGMPLVSLANLGTLPVFDGGARWNARTCLILTPRAWSLAATRKLVHAASGAPRADARPSLLFAPPRSLLGVAPGLS